MTHIRRTTFPLILGALLLLGACEDDDLVFQEAGTTTILLTVEGLPPLEGGLNYQAWVVRYSNYSYWGSPLGIFNMNESGQMADPVSGAVLSGSFTGNADPAEVYGVQVTVELSSAVVSQPSLTYLMGGTVYQGVANLTLDSWLGIGENFSPMEGQYILKTPSDNDGGNELSGLWFVNARGESEIAGLFLPEAPSGWDFEAWVVTGTDTLSTGKFFSPNISDTTNLYGGLTGSPPFPGQDFLYNAPDGISFPLDLSGGSVFVTLEPADEWDVAPGNPFFLRLMEATIPSDAIPGTTYDLLSLFDAFPKGTATVINP